MNIMKLPCVCGELVETKVYPDNWYVLQHYHKGQLIHWKVGFAK